MHYMLVFVNLGIDTEKSHLFILPMSYANRIDRQLHDARPKEVVTAHHPPSKMVLCAGAIKNAPGGFKAGPPFFCSGRRTDHGAATLSPSYGISTSREVRHHWCL